ncbi:MAG: TonB family protein [Elusimicrobiaceae bacterium]|nr:TonB family protein [Elusimicrobiaceae bacterium]
MEMRRYYLYSGMAHAGLLLAALLLVKPAAPRQIFPSYTVDFIGGTEAAPVSDSKPAGPEPAAPAPKTEPARKTRPAKPVSEKFRAPKDKAKVLKEDPPAASEPEKLTAPSVLEEEPAESPSAPQNAAAQGDAAPTGISAQFPNFPYPWYITQVRLALWNEWSSRMPRSGNISCVIAFFVRRDGTVRKIDVEKSSGNKLFNLAALTSVENSAPLPPLPASYKEQELAVHVEFKIAQ